MLSIGNDIHIEEKIPILPAGGGGWDKKRKRKRSSGAAGNRRITVEKIVKQAVRVKLSAETMLQPPQAQCCRSMASSRKISRTPKTCSIPVLDSSSDFCNSSGADASGEQGVNKIKSASLTAVNSKISPMSSSSSASEMSHLVVRRPLSILRTGKADFVSPAFKNDEVRILSQGLSSSGVGARPSRGVGVLPHVARVEIHSPNSKVEPLRFSSPAMFSATKMVNSGFPAFSGELDDDREELLIAADFARNASYRACSNSFWKKLECYFASVTSQNESYLKHQLDFADAISGSLYRIPEDESDVLQNDEAPSLFQRLISALIEDDVSKGMGFHREGRNDSQCASDNYHCGSRNYNHFDAENRDRMASTISSPNCNYHTLSVEDKIRVQLKSIDLCPKMHQIAEGEDAINKDIIELEAGLVQQAQKKKRYIRKIYESIQHGKDAEKRNLEQTAMNKLIEMAYKRQRVSHESHSSKRVLRRVSKHAALPFVERTLAKCLEFEDTGRSCFRKAALQNIIFSTPMSNSVPNSVDKQASRSSKSKYSLPSHNLQPKGSGSRDKEQYMGMNRDFLPNDVCTDSSRAMPGGSAKGKRKERVYDRTIKIISKKSAPRIVPPPVGSRADVRESKLKPKVKANLLASGAEPGSRYMEPTHAVSDSPRASSLSMAIGSDVARRNEEAHNVGKNLVNPPTKQLTKSISFERRDSTSLLDFDEDGMQDQDWQGLDIPMDDLSDVHFAYW